MINLEEAENFIRANIHTLGHRSKSPGAKVVKRETIVNYLEQNGYAINLKILNMAVREYSGIARCAGIKLVPTFRQRKSFLTVEGSLFFIRWLANLENLKAHIELWENSYLEQSARGRKIIATYQQSLKTT